MRRRRHGLILEAESEGRGGFWVLDTEWAALIAGEKERERNEADFALLNLLLFCLLAFLLFDFVSLLCFDFSFFFFSLLIFYLVVLLL